MTDSRLALLFDDALGLLPEMHQEVYARCTSSSLYTLTLLNRKWRDRVQHWLAARLSLGLDVFVPTEAREYGIVAAWHGRYASGIIHGPTWYFVSLRPTPQFGEIVLQDLDYVDATKRISRKWHVSKRWRLPETWELVPLQVFVTDSIIFELCSSDAQKKKDFHSSSKYATETRWDKGNLGYAWSLKPSSDELPSARTEALFRNTYTGTLLVSNTSVLEHASPIVFVDDYDALLDELRRALFLAMPLLEDPKPSWHGIVAQHTAVPGSMQ